MSEGAFLSNENVEMLWELILDEDIFKTKSKQQMKHFQTFFILNIQDFFKKMGHIKTNLMELNKTFIEHIFNQISTNSNAFKIEIMESNVRESNVRESNVRESNVRESNVREPIAQNITAQNITAEDIQNARMSDFEKEFKKKQNDFSNAMTLKAPEKPNFNDEMDKPIGEMEDLIARTLAQRNFDIEQINQNIDKEKADTFLKSQKTSIKNEKMTKYNVEQNEVKYIKIGSEDLPKIDVVEVVDIQRANDKRHITWADDNNATKENSNNNISIFSKLKLKTQETATDFEKINKRIDELDSKITEIFRYITNTNNTSMVVQEKEA